MITTGTLDDLYFEWLYGFIGSVKNRNPSRSFWQLMRQLYVKPYSWYIGNDENRAIDGKELREEFLAENDIDEVDPLWMDLECSVLEMLMALARRASFESCGEPIEWFWQFLENLGLRKYKDEVYNESVEKKVDDILERFINRTYKRNGAGGIFPLKYAKDDQREVELWYQMSTYLLEGGYVDNGM